MSKHFNLGNVWGRVSSVKKEKSEGKGTPYLAITVECGNELYGNVKTYGRLWGQDKIDAFMNHYKNNTGSAYRFTGFFSQYEKEGLTYSNYTFFKWQPFDGSEFKASFVLVGELTAIEKEAGGETVIHLHIIREGQGTYKDIEEDFRVYAFNSRELDGVEDGAVVECAGFLRSREPEDDFGRASGAIRPYAMEITPRKRDDQQEGEPY